MKNITKTSLSLIILSAFVVFPVASDAQLTANLTGSATGTIDSVINADANTALDTDSGINSETNANIELDLGNNAGDADTNDQPESDSDISLKVNSSGVAVVSSSQVSSEADLEVFSSNVSAREEAVEEVDINSDADGESQVKVVYKHRGKLLNLIPATVKSTIVVEIKDNEETEVKSKKSWYAFLVAGEDYSKTELESRIKNNATVNANAKVNASASAKAQIAEAIIAEAAASINSQTSINR